MKIPIYIIRNTYGQVTAASHRTDMLPAGQPCKVRIVATSKQLAVAMLQTGSRQKLIDAAWRKAVAAGAVEASRPFRHGEPFDVQSIEHGKQESDQLNAFISELVNDPNSKFYIYG